MRFTMSRTFKIALLIVSLAHACNCQYEELSCNDNATCIEHLTKQIIRGVRQNKTIRVFDLFSIEPIPPVKKDTGRSNEGMMAKFFNNHAVRVEMGNFAVRVLRSPEKGASVAVEIEHEEGRAKNTKKPRQPHHGKKIMQVLLPMVLGVKSASTMIVAIAAVAMLTFKAFLASKLALLVTGTMAVKKLMEMFGGSAPMPQHQPYMYPVDFNAAGTHPGYAMPGSAYGTPEMYGVPDMGGHELLQQPIHNEQIQDVSGQYSQGVAEIQNPNATSAFNQAPAAKRWDGLIRKPMFYDSPSQYGYQEYDP